MLKAVLWPEASPNRLGDPSVAGKRAFRVTELEAFAYPLLTLINCQVASIKTLLAIRQSHVQH